MGKLSDDFQARGLKHEQVLRVLDGLESEGFGLQHSDEAAKKKGFVQLALLTNKVFICTLFDRVTRQVAIIECKDLSDPKAGMLRRGPIDQISQPKLTRLRDYRKPGVS